MNKVIKDYNIKVAKFNVPFSLNTNYDGSDVETPSISILNDKFTTLNCINCHTRGDALFEFEVAGTWHSLNRYRLALSGRVDGNLDIELNVLHILLQAQEPQHIKQNKVLKEVDFNPISIAGVMTIEPSFVVNSVIDFEAHIGKVVKGGLDVAYPFDFSLSSKENRIFSAPNFVSSGKPVITPHQIHVEDTLGSSAASIVLFF